MLKRVLGIDQLHWSFLFLGLVVAVLIFVAWYPFVIGAIGWERSEYIVIDSWIAQAIGSLVITCIIGLLYRLRFWLLLRWLAKKYERVSQGQSGDCWRYHTGRKFCYFA